jgi:DNA (cytosine-5)-methyltransferase 3A
MNVLSLFDGISCARVALDRAGIEVNAYMASEIEKNAIKVSEKNYPDIIRVGSVVGLEVEGQVDLLIGGSPCTDLSIAKKDRKGLEGDKSCLFWEFVRIKNECKPQWFVLENVASMPKADRDIITREMGVEPVMFNASLVSAQCRKRLFWTNIPFDLPEDRGILLKHILEADVDEKFYIKKTMSVTAQTNRNETKKLGYVTDKDHQANRVYDGEGKLPALASVCNSMVKVGYVGEGEQYGQGGQAHRVYSTEGKTPTISSGPALIKVGHVEPNVQGNRVYSTEGKATALSAEGGGLAGGTTLVEVQGIMIPEATKQGYVIAEEGDSVDLSFPNSKTRRGRVGQKAKNIMTGSTIGVVQNQSIRKLTPIECERLQGLPDNYTEGVAMTHRYRCLGNAFNVDVVAHILSRVKLMYSS